MLDFPFLKQFRNQLLIQIFVGIIAVVVSYFLILNIISTNSIFFKNSDLFSFQARNGHFICCDLQRKNILIADRYQVGIWEQFAFHKDDGNYFQIITSEGKQVEKNNQNNLFGIPVNSGLKASWIFEKKGDSILIHDKTGNYWHLASDSRIVTSSRELADSFILVDKNRVVPFRDYLLIILGFSFLVLAIIFFQAQVHPWFAIVVLMIAGVFLVLYAIGIFDFLLLWDEQYHALVAKNMISHPFKPMLYVDPLLPYDYKSWTSNHVWLHKQPLFLWQIAISIWVFGAKEWAVRFPDLIMTLLLIPVIYRMGKIVVDNQTGFWAAVFFTVSHFLFRLITGSTFTDHNDVAFLFYVTLSLWAWLEYEFSAEKSRRQKFIILVGLFTGAAVLVKWLPGLLVYSGWGLSILTSRESRKEIKCYLDLLLSLLITTLIALPWQIYILLRFPQEAKFEFNLTSSHFLTPIEGHSGDGMGWHYYFNNFQDSFSISIGLLIASSIVFIIIAKKRKIASLLIFILAFVFTFYSIAATKMPAFTFITLPIILLAFASLFTVLDRLFSSLISFRFLHIILMTILIMNVATAHYRLKEKFLGYYPLKGDTEKCVSMRRKLAGLYREFGRIIPENQQSHYVFLNCHEEEIPHMMFYTKIKAAYFKVNIQELGIIKSRKDLKIGYIVYADEEIPDYILNDNAILKIRFSKPIFVSELGKCF